MPADSSPGGRRIEVLLAHREWMARTARALVRGDAEAEDLEQEAWLGILRGPPAETPRSPRAWLRSVLRFKRADRARAEAVRRRHEEAAARPEAGGPGPQDVVARAEVAERVARMVLELEEPLRTTVLFRYYDGLEPRAIAVRQGIPVATVRTRLHRALGLLRKRLDATGGGDPAYWRHALLPLAGGGGAPGGYPGGAEGVSQAAAAAGVLMQASTKGVAAAAVLLLGGFAWWMLRPGPVAPGLEDRATEVGAAADRDGGRVAPPTAPGRRPGPAKGGEEAKGPVPVARGPGSAFRSPPGPPPADLPDGPAGAGEVAGRVLLLPDRTPVAGALVSLAGGGPGRDAAPYPEKSFATTGPNGVFRIGGFSPGDYLFRAEAEGRGSRMFHATVTRDAGAGGIEVLFGSGGGVEGRVDGLGGRPLAGAPVRIEGQAGCPVDLHTKTDAGGEYRFEDVPPGSCVVHVVEGESRERFAGVEVSAGSVARLDFAGSASLSGLVTEADGRPLAGAIIRARRTVERRYDSSQAVSGKDGRYGIASLEPGEWTVGIQVLGSGAFAAEVGTVRAAPGGTLFDIRLDREDLAGEISGRVFRAGTGEPIPPYESGHNQFQIDLYALAEKTPGSWEIRASAGMAFLDDRGSFRFRAVRPGRYRILVHSFTSVEGAERDVELGPGERKEGLEFPLADRPARPPRAPSAAYLSGIVRDAEGRPVVRAMLSASSGAVGRIAGMATTDDVGRYRLEGLEPGEWYLSLSVTGKGTYGIAEVATVQVRAGENTADVDLDREDLAGEISGRVCERASGAPLPAGQVMLLLLAEPPGGRARAAGTTVADAEGRYRLRWVRPGRYRLLAATLKDRLRRQERDVALGRGEKAAGVDLQVEEVPTGRVRYALKDPEGRPVDAVAIQASRDGRIQPGAFTDTGEKGVFDVSYEPGTYRVEFRSPRNAVLGETTVRVSGGAIVQVEMVLRGL